jgi:DNA-binding XRE family transcriptional regulator
MLRAYHGLSQEQLEEKADLDFRTYSNKERGRVKFKLSDVLKIARFYKLSLAEVNEIFFNGELK